MAGGNHYRGKRPKERSGCGWTLFAFGVLCALLLCYGQSKPLIRLREQVCDRLENTSIYEDAVAQVGKLFSGEVGTPVTDVFGQLFFGEEQTEE